MRKITEIAGGIALLVYRQQRLTPNDMDFMGIRFRYDNSQWKDEPQYDKFQQDLVDMADGNLADLQNAIEYLNDFGLMTFTDDNDTAQRGYRNFHITAKGVHLIEGVENNTGEGKRRFNITFNFNLESIAKIEPTLKAQFGLVNL
ncbi:MAG TPA: hypothetical protein VFQ70_03010 [Candidatus Saccharimonadaceae bacterium]|nr:hypothetical protein [Candidatus Saccharimonadaceae bacterium]